QQSSRHPRVQSLHWLQQTADHNYAVGSPACVAEMDFFKKRHRCNHEYEELHMKTRLLASILLVALAAFAEDKLQRLNIKTGLWENTTTITSQGQMPIPTEM